MSFIYKVQDLWFICPPFLINLCLFQAFRKCVSTPLRFIKRNKKVSFIFLLLLSIVGPDFTDVFGKYEKKSTLKWNRTLRGISALSEFVIELYDLDSRYSARKRKHIYLYLMDAPLRSEEPLATLAPNLLPEEFLACQHTSACIQWTWQDRLSWLCSGTVWLQDLLKCSWHLKLLIASLSQHHPVNGRKRDRWHSKEEWLPCH